MKQFLRVLLGVALLPCAWGSARAFFDTLVAMPTAAGALFPPGVLPLLAGVAACLVGWFVFPKPVRAYVLGHELTHAFFALLSGARVKRLRVGSEGGSVQVSKSNVLVTLSPYFVPFYTVLVILAALVVRVLLGRLPCVDAWSFLVGVTWCFHCCFTVQSLMQRQTDIEEYGHIFSWTVIFLANVLLAMAWLTLTSPLSPRVPAAALLTRVAAAYEGVGGWTRCAIRRAESAFGARR